MPYLPKAIRNLAYGVASVAFPIALHRIGVPPLQAGVIITLGLIAGAAQSFSAGRLAARFSLRLIVLGSALAMCAGALLGVTGHVALLAFGALLGGFNVSNQEIGPFAAIEQVAIAEHTGAVRRLAVYNAVGTVALACGAVLGAIFSGPVAFIFYAAAGAALFLTYARAPFPKPPATRARDIPTRHLSGIAERIAGLFALDAFAGGLVVQGFITYWFVIRFHPDPRVLGATIAFANVLAGLSLFFAAWLGQRIGLLRAMVFTHLPSNLLLAAIPLAPTFPVAAALLVARSALSQMDVPTRQALVLEAVPLDERTHAAGVTTAVRPAAAAFSPALAGMAMQSAFLGAPFFVAGALKALYDILIFFTFRELDNRIARNRQLV